MSTTPSTFNIVNTSYTVIGAHKNPSGSSDDLSVLILNRGGRPFRGKLIEELVKLEVKEIFVVERSILSQQDFEKECLDNDKLRFILLKELVTPGEMINIGITESSTNNLFVLWDDMIIDAKMVSYRVFDTIKEHGRLCTVPMLKDPAGNKIPTFMTPLFNKGLLKVVPIDDAKNLKSLYPYQFTGIYNKDLFIKSGGFDIRIRNSYYQNMDFGVRVNLWGESIKMNPSLSLTLYPSDSQIDDITPDFGYRLFSLKNLSISIKSGKGILPFRRFFHFYDKLGYSLIESHRLFRDVQVWVKKNRLRFIVDAPTMTKEWDKI